MSLTGEIFTSKRTCELYIVRLYVYSITLIVGSKLKRQMLTGQEGKNAGFANTFYKKNQLFHPPFRNFWGTL